MIDAHDQRRVLGLSGAPNFRDLGGYRTESGARVRTGRVYRSGKLTALTGEDRARLDALNIHCVIDLRAQDERDHDPSEWPRRPPDVHECSRPSLRPEMHATITDLATAEGARAGFTAFYARLPDIYRDEFAVLFKRLAGGPASPTLVHCSAGKDRTGVACALLLWTLGVPRETIVADYVLTARLMTTPPPLAYRALAPAGATLDEQAAMAPVPDDVRRVLWGAEPGYIASALDAVEQAHGSIEGYLERALGLTDGEVLALRTSLLE